jgi:hypothetical protein
VPAARTVRAVRAAQARANAPRTDWRDAVSTAADLALIGIAVTLAAAPLVTAGAAVRTGSLAVGRVVAGERVPPAGDLWRAFRRSLLPGLAAAVVVLAAAGLLVVDLLALSRGRVPGGPVAIALTAGVAAAAAAVAALTVVRLGRHADTGWLVALRWAAGTVLRRPGTAAGTVAVLALAGALAVLVPATAPLVVGFALFALHVAARRAG